MRKIKNKGFSLVELLIGIAIFLVISLAIYHAYSTILKTLSASRSKIVAMDLANELFEIVRNLPYSDVGIVSGIPSGKLQRVQTLVRSGYSFVATTTVRNIDDPFDGTIGGNPNDLSPADNKLVEIEVGCSSCRNFPPVTVNTRVAPKNLETASTNGALFVNVLDANGQPVPDADIHLVNSIYSPQIIIDDTTNTSGVLQIVDVPPGVNAYEITVSKSGYTIDKTYSPDASGNPNPTKPHATVALQQVTQISFVIDKVSSMNVFSKTQTCAPVSSVSFSLTGARLIGANPDVLKYNQNHTTDGSGEKTILNLEWDSYLFTLNDLSYDLVGMSPVFPVDLSPDSAKDVELVVAEKNPKSLLVTVKDAASALPLASSTVRLVKESYDNSLITGWGFLRQTDWSGGSGQDIFTDQTKYYSSSFIDTNNPMGEIKLSGAFGVYDENGALTSSTFDTGSQSNFRELEWLPLSQPPQAGAESVKFQLATNNDSLTWNFIGPDGASESYYTAANTNINSIHSGDRFLRYKAYLSTANASYTPNVSDVSFTFTSSCIPPGQVIFTGLPSGTYNLTISKDNYVTYTGQVDISSSWKEEQVSLQPQ